MKGRGPVVHLDRSGKARMIEAVLTDFRGAPVEDLRTLDIGCGNGGISAYFSRLNDHYAVDITDQRKVFEPEYQFRHVDNETLPFEDCFFDVVLSNHVIEHVPDQQRHLAEIRRVLKSDGIVYLATPNRSSPIMEGHVGNVLVLRYREMAPLFLSSGFKLTEYGLNVARNPKRFHGEVRWARHFPTALLRLMRPLFPSHIFILIKDDQSS